MRQSKKKILQRNKEIFEARERIQQHAQKTQEEGYDDNWEYIPLSGAQRGQYFSGKLRGIFSGQRESENGGRKFIYRSHCGLIVELNGDRRYYRVYAPGRRGQKTYLDRSGNPSNDMEKTHFRNELGSPTLTLVNQS